MNIGFTGTQVGMTDPQKVSVRSIITSCMSTTYPTTFHHGDCEGADKEFHDIVRDIYKEINHQYSIVIHPPINPKKPMEMIVNSLKGGGAHGIETVQHVYSRRI